MQIFSVYYAKDMLTTRVLQLENDVQAEKVSKHSPSIHFRTKH